MGSAAKEGGFRELMKRVLHQFLTAKKEKLIESPFERDCEQHQTTAFFESELLNFPFPGNCMLLEEAMDAVQSQLAGQIELCLSSSKKSQLHCQELLIPKHLCQRIARDIMYMSANEPCGLRGAVIYVNLEVDGLCKTLGRIQQDSSVPPTFELTLVFKADKSNWFRLKHFLNVGAYFGPGYHKVLKLSPGFRLVKKKLYSSDGPVIQEF
ncbi:DDT4L protein, partial [Polypterus senegalus]|nr:DNA damage-inducible transcript 4-like protein [Polypterus senegalus]MBN3294764.1 DDT4L protein [Polypterus senegalus]